MDIKANAEMRYAQKVADLSKQFSKKVKTAASVALQKETSNLFRHRHKKNHRLDVHRFKISLLPK